MKKLLALLSLSALTLTACGTETVVYEYQNDPSPEAIQTWSEIAGEFEYLEFGAVEKEEGTYFLSTDIFSGVGVVGTRIYRENDKGIMKMADFELSYTDLEGLEDWVMPITHLIGYGTDKRGKNFFLTLAQDMSDSPGPCTEVYLLDGTNAPGVRSINKLYLDGYAEPRFEAFEIPEEVKAEALAKQETCLSTLN